MEFSAEAVAVGIQVPALPTPPAFSAIVNDALFCTTNNVLLRSPRRLVAESYEAWEFGRPATTFRTPFDSRLCHLKPHNEVLDGVTTAFRSIRKSYYHTIVDNLPRLALLHHERYQSVDSIRVLVDGSMNRAERFLTQLLLPGNCAITTIEPQTVYRVEKYVLLSHLSYQFAAALHPTLVGFLRERIHPRREPTRSRRILVSRQAAPRGRRITNFDALATALEREGFEIHALENYSLADQIDLFFDAETIVAPHGAGLANLLFSPDRVRVVELFASPEVFPHYYFLTKSLGQIHRYLTGAGITFNDDFKADVEGVLRHLNS